MSDLQNYIMCSIILVISTLIIREIFSRSRASGLPPSPLALPIIGHLHLLGPLPHQSFHKLSSKYGPLIYLLLGSAPCILVSSAETAKEFLKNHEHAFASRPFSTAVHFLTYNSADFSFAPYGAYWKFMKKLVMSELLSGRTLDRLFPVRHQEIQKFLKLMLVKSNAGEVANVGEELITMANNVITRMMMSTTCSDTEDDAEEVRKMVNEVAVLTGKFNLSDYIGICKNLDLQGFKKRLEDVHARFDILAEKFITGHEKRRKQRKETGDEGDGVKDILDILLDVMEDENAEMTLTRENIKAFILDIFSAGTDTSAITIDWAIAELVNHPNILMKAREEIYSVVGKSRLVAESDMPNLPYLQAIVKEVLRLHPTGPLNLRLCTEDTKIGDYHIPANTRIFINNWALGRDPRYWDYPLEFRPLRFMNEEGSDQSQTDFRGQHFHYLPFGSGRRMCPGTSLALQIVQTTLACTIQCFDWKVGEGKNTTVDMTEAPGLTLPRAHPLVCVPVAILDPFPLN